VPVAGRYLQAGRARAKATPEELRIRLKRVAATCAKQICVNCLVRHARRKDLDYFRVRCQRAITILLILLRQRRHGAAEYGTAHLHGIRPSVEDTFLSLGDHRNSNTFGHGHIDNFLSVCNQSVSVALVPRGNLVTSSS